MKDVINSVNSSIMEKKSRLFEKTDMYFSGIVIPSSMQSSKTTMSKKTPPISYILYGVSGLSAIGGLCADATISKVSGIAVAALSAYGGYRLASAKGGHVVQPSSSINIGAVKNEISAKVIDIVKRIKSDWENFMDSQQKILQNAIQSSSFSDEVKDSMISKIFVYEVLDINISDFNNQIRSLTNAYDLRIAVNSFKTKLTSSIDVAANRQINKYNSIC